MRKTIATALLLTLSSLSFASDLIPAYPNQSCDNHVCASISKGTSYDLVNITSLKVPVFKNYKAHLLINGSEYGQAEIKIENRGGIPTAHIVIPTNTHGAVEVYFEDGKGNYISDYGRNFHFFL